MLKGQLPKVPWPGNSWMSFTVQAAIQVLQQPHKYSYSLQLAKLAHHDRVIPGQVITKNGRSPSDFNETWYMHTLSEVINAHPFLASYVIWLLSYNFSKIQFFGKFSVNQWYLIDHNLWTDCFWQLYINYTILFLLSCPFRCYITRSEVTHLGSKVTVDEV